MVLTDRQRADLHAGIYEYLRSQNGKYWDEAADAMAEADPSCVRDSKSVAGDDASVTTASTRMSRLTTASSMSRVAGLPVLERKWTAVPRLQRKVLELEKALANNAKMYANRSAATNGGGLVSLPAGSNIERRMTCRNNYLCGCPSNIYYSDIWIGRWNYQSMGSRKWRIHKNV